MAKKDLSLTNSHSIEEAEVRHQAKHAKHRHPESLENQVPT